MSIFDYTIEAKSGHARVGTYETAHGTFTTPMFMPVGTHATVKGITSRGLHELNSQVVLANTYHLYMRPGVDVVEEAAEIRLARRALRALLDVAKDPRERLVEVLVAICAREDAREELARRDEIAFFRHEVCPRALGLRVIERGIVEVRRAALALALVDVVGEVLRDIAIEEHPEHILLEIPAIDAPAQVVRDLPDRPMELRALLFFRRIHSHASLVLIAFSHTVLFYYNGTRNQNKNYSEIKTKSNPSPVAPFLFLCSAAGFRRPARRSRRFPG